MVRVCDGVSLPKRDRTAILWLHTFGGEAHEIRTVVDPADPVRVARPDGQNDMHKNWWERDPASPTWSRGRPTGAPASSIGPIPCICLTGEARTLAGPR